MANKVILLGRLGSDPALTVTANSQVAKFSLATSETYKGKTTVQWHKIVAWGKLAEICGKHLVKGQQAYFEGKIQYREWEKDEKKYYATEIVVDKMEFGGSKKVEDYSEIPF